MHAVLSPVGDQDALLGQVQVEGEEAATIAIIDVPLLLLRREEQDGDVYNSINISIKEKCSAPPTHVMCLFPIAVCWCSQSEVARPGT